MNTILMGLLAGIGIYLLGKSNSLPLINGSNYVDPIVDPIIDPIVVLDPIIDDPIVVDDPIYVGVGEWPHEPIGNVVLYDWAFDLVEGPGMTDEYNSGRIGQDSSAIMSPPNILAACIDPGQGGGAVVWNDLDSRELFTGFYFSYDYGVDRTHPNLFNKIIFDKSPNIPGYLLAYGPEWHLQWDLQPDANAGVNNCHIPGAWGDADCHILPSNIRLQPNRWYQIEYRLRTSTTNSSRDGIIQMWVDGNVVMNLNNVNWGPGNFYEQQITQTWDVDPSRSYRTDRWCQNFDHYHLSVPR